MKHLFGLCLLSCFAASAAHAAIVTKNLDYDVDGKKMQSVLVYDDAVKTARPGIVMTPDWLGITADNLALAKQIADKDYVILVADVFGVEVRPKNPGEAGAASKPLYEHRDVLLARASAALAQLKAQAGKAPLDGRHWGAIGFALGGTAALELARSGADVGAVVSFHGNLATDDPALSKNIKAKVLALNGGDDKTISQDSIAAFEKEMRDAKVDWQFLDYGGAVHCFAVPSARGEVPGCAYHERTAKRAFRQMREFFGEAFGAT